jgi:hypothetical protein
VITRDLRRALARAVAAAGFEAAAEPGLRPTGTPGQYAASVALALGANPAATAAAIAAGLRAERWIASAEVTGPGYLTVTVTPESLAAVADAVTAAGPACVTSDALAGVTVPAATPGDPLAAPTWEKARAALAARLAVGLAAAAGATIANPAGTERNRLTAPAHASSQDPSKPSARAAPEHFTKSDAAGVSRTRSEDSQAEPTAMGHRPQTGIREDEGSSAAARQGNNGEAGARKSRLCCQVRARPRRVRGALGSYFPGGRPLVLRSGRRGYGCSPAGGDRPARPSRRPGGAGTARRAVVAT